ncbi:MAG: hypothetical protein LUE93_15610 [Bacteroides sp.]|nr:hypothetical protein [Bacteroides sp.]
MKTMQLTGAEILLRRLQDHGTTTIFGYPGSCVMPVLDSICAPDSETEFILVRHEQGAVHAAHGYSEISGKPGIVIVTSGPGATNTVTGIAEAMRNHTPLIVFTGQVHSTLLGTDAFQEVDIIGITQAVCKWSYQIRRADQIEEAINQAFEIACSGIPGPVLIDITKDAQTEKAQYPVYRKNHSDGSVYQKIFRYLNELDLPLILSMDLEKGREQMPFLHKKIQVLISEVPGFALPAAMGAGFAFPAIPSCVITSPQTFQHTFQELALVLQNQIIVRIILIHSVKEKQNGEKYPCFLSLMEAYGIPGETNRNENLREAIIRTFQSPASYFLEIIPD